jgi:LuxR family maltose regulon positive regulatory protein
MTFLLRNLAGPLHIVVATQADSLLPLGRMRAQGELSELSAPDLRFTTDEAGTLLRKRFGIDVSDHDVEALVATTEGWPAGLYLAGVYLAGEPGRRASDFQGSHRHVADFMRAEVLNRQPEPLRDFMLRTSILDRMSPALCDAVTDDDGAALMLGDLERSNLFVVPLDDDGEWFRYHLLFRDMLRAEAARIIGPELPTLHRRASRWHAGHGTAVEAVRHALASEDVALTVEMVKANWLVQTRRGHRATTWSWLQALPWDVTSSDPHLCAIAAFVLTFAGDFDAAGIWLSRIPGDVPAPAGGLVGGFSSVASIAQIVLAHPVHSVSAAIRASEAAMSLEPPGSEWRSAARVALGVNLYLVGRLTEARAQLEVARVEATTAPRPAVEMIALAFLSLVEHDVGDPSSADELALEARRLAEGSDVVDYPLLAPLHVVSAAAFARRGERDRAEDELGEAARLAASYGPSLIPALTALLAARLRLSWGEVESCRALLREAHACLNACTDVGALREVFVALDARSRARGSRHDGPEALTSSEVAVLRLLATDLSLGEVAARLFVSINTIKTHTRHIYQKLAVPSRAAAVERARALDLI